MSTNPKLDWRDEHNRRQSDDTEFEHRENGQVASATVSHKRDVDGRLRPEMQLYVFSERQLDASGQPVLDQSGAPVMIEKRRFRTRLHASDSHALVIRVSNNGPVGAGDPANGLHVQPNGEILIKPVEGADVRFEFRIDNPGDGLGDYKC